MSPPWPAAFKISTAAFAIALLCSACSSEGSGAPAPDSGGNSGSDGTMPITTADVVCGLSKVVLNPTLGVTSQATWSCANGARTLSANGIPDHAVGVFPNPENPNAITAQAVQFTATLTPTASTPQMVTPWRVGYHLNGVRFDPLTAGSCPANAKSVSDCTLIGPPSQFGLLALGQSLFKFGVDQNNGHVQPDGAYHYHGVPEATLTAAGASAATPKIVLIGFAADGYPIYARFGYAKATEASSGLKTLASSYRLKANPDPGRPAVSVIPMGAFTVDYEYVPGLGDLDECNGRFGVTPEFPKGIYHYYATDAFPFLPNCWKGALP